MRPGNFSSISNKSRSQRSSERASPRLRDPLIRRTGFLFVAAVQAVLILVVGGGYLGCSRHESGEGAALESSGTDAEIAQPRGDFPIVLISIDTLRSDHLPVYGYDAVDTPYIDRLRQDSILFEHVYSPYPLTLPAHVSLLTGPLMVCGSTPLAPSISIRAASAATSVR